MLHAEGSLKDRLSCSAILMKETLSTEKLEIIYRSGSKFLRNTNEKEEKEYDEIKGLIGKCFNFGEEIVTFKSFNDDSINPIYDIETVHTILTLPLKLKDMVTAVVQLEYQKSFIKGLNVSLESIDPIDYSLLKVFFSNLTLILAQSVGRNIV